MILAAAPNAIIRPLPPAPPRQPPSSAALVVARVLLAGCIILGTIPRTADLPDHQKSATTEVMRGMFGCKWLRIYLDGGNTFDKSEEDRLDGIRWRNVCRGLEGF